MDASELIALYRHPRHWGRCDDPTHEHEAANPLCGDGLIVTVRVVADRIEAVGFDGAGCSVSVASASLLGDRVVGTPVSAVVGITGAEAIALTGVPKHRHRCALLPLMALRGALGEPPTWQEIESDA